MPERVRALLLSVYNRARHSRMLHAQQDPMHVAGAVKSPAVAASKAWPELHPPCDST